MTSIGGRPKKAPEERRTAQNKQRYTASEIGYITTQAALAGITPTEYIRRAALGLRVSAQKKRADAALITELCRIGNNINQLARSVNRGRGLPEYWRDMAKELEDILKKLARNYGS